MDAGVGQIVPPGKCVFKPVLIAHLFSPLFLKMDLLQEFYETTLEALKDAKNDRLWFKTNTKVYRGLIFFFFSFLVFLTFAQTCFFFLFLQLGKLYLEREEYGKLQKILRQLHQSCQVIVNFNSFR